MNKYTFQLFDSKNTCIKIEREKTLRQASNFAKQLSEQKEYHHIIVSGKGGFEEFENGELVSWSYPNGLGMIKANS